MYINQSYNENSSNELKPSQKEELEENDNMQILARRILNTSRNALKSRQKPFEMMTNIMGVASTPNHNVTLKQMTHYSTKDQEPKLSTVMSGKQKLLRFPAMPLNDTLKLFLTTCEPLLSCSEMEETRKSVESFCRKEGPKLQSLLVQAACKEDNWLADRWLRAAYMQFREPVTIFSSPGMTFPLQKPFCGDEEVCNYAAKLIFNLIKYKELVDQDKIPIVKMGKLELDNSQFGKVFGTCRIPGLPEDTVEYHPDSKHVVVIHKNNFYKLPVYDEQCKPLHICVLSKELLKIMSSGDCEGCKFGLLSTDKRDNWATIYKELMEDDQNKCNIAEIQKSLFTVSLDEAVVIECNKEYVELSEQLIHGGGPKLNAGNRWMDKTIQLIINPSGLSGFTYEHSPAEGQPIALIVDYVIKNMKDDKFYESGSKSSCQGMTKLPLKKTNSFDKAIQCVEKLLCELEYDLELVILHYKNYGKGFLKSQKLSPDSFVQMAQQLAFYKLHGKPAAHYESAHLRIFKDGRTETIRSCSNESLAFAECMTNCEAGPEQKVKALKEAVNSHRNYTTLALQGKGVDRHLLGLKLMAIENNMPIPSVFSCPGYVKSAHFRLATSQVASSNPVFMCYGPMVKNGYSCCYNPREDDMYFAIGGWRSCPETNASVYTKSLNESLNMMAEILLEAGGSAKPKSKM